MSVAERYISVISLPPVWILVVHFRVPVTKDTLEMDLSV